MKDAQEEERRTGDGGAVNRARAYLETVLAGTSPAAEGPYGRQIAALYDSIIGREAEKEAPPPEEQAFKWYLDRLNEAARNGREGEHWPI